jgi:hypothetical protein
MDSSGRVDRIFNSFGAVAKRLGLLEASQPLGRACPPDDAEFPQEIQQSGVLVPLAFV